MKNVCLFVLCFLHAQFNLCAQANADSSLICYYSFEENTIDYSLFGNHATAFGNPTYVDGIKGKAIRLDGQGDYLTVLGTNSLHQISEAYTIATWIKVDTIIDFYIPVMTKGNDYDMNTPLAIVYRSPQTTPYIRIQGENQGWQTTNLVDVENACPTGEWVFISWTFKEGLVSVYKNGEQVATQQFNFVNLATNNTPMDIGRDLPGFNTEWLNGELDEFCIFNRALDAREVKTLFEQKSTSTQNILANEVQDLMFEVYPNPTSGAIHLQTNIAGEKSVLIFSSNGSLILSQNFDQQLLNIPMNLVAGNYVVAVVDVYGKKFVKQLIVTK